MAYSVTFYKPWFKTSGLIILYHINYKPRVTVSFYYSYTVCYCFYEYDEVSIILSKVYMFFQLCNDISFLWKLIVWIPAFMFRDSEVP